MKQTSKYIIKMLINYYINVVDYIIQNRFCLDKSIIYKVMEPIFSI